MRKLSARPILTMAAAVLLLACSSEEKSREPLPGAACVEEDSGVEVGDFAQDFALQDQFGETVLLSDYCGKVVYIQFAAMWCPTCRAQAAKISDYLSDYEADGLAILNIVTETASSETPTRDDLATWAQTFDIESPVMADPDWGIWDRYFDAHSTPRAMLLDREGRILVKDFILDEDEIVNAL